MSEKTSFSQCGEDILIDFLARDILHLENISYLDLGCNDPVEFNNTYLMSLQGFKGVSVDANPFFGNKFKEIRPKDIFVCAGVGPKNTSSTFYVIEPHTLSTFSKKEAEEYTATGTHKLVKTKKTSVISIEKILKKYFKKTKPSILFVDVEGYDFDILKSIDLNSWKPAIICAETLTYSAKGEGIKIKKIFDLLEKSGYSIYADTYINSIFVSNEIWSSATNAPLDFFNMLSNSKINATSPIEITRNNIIEISSKAIAKELGKRSLRKILQLSKKAIDKISFMRSKSHRAETTVEQIDIKDHGKELPVEYSFDHFINLPFPHQKCMDKLFNDDDAICVFDVGACEGEDTIRYANKYPNSMLHSFEPIPDNLKKVKSNIKKYTDSERVKINMKALSDKTGKSSMHVSSGTPTDIEPIKDWDYGNKSSSLLRPAKTKEITPWLKFKKTIQVSTDTIDNYCSKNKIKKIDLIHMDVQGAELMVLNGAKNMLPHIKSIWLEVEAVELYKGQPLKSDVEKFMKASGFIKALDTVNEVAGDQFYVNKLALKDTA